MQIVKLNGKVELVPAPVEAVEAAFWTMGEEDALRWLEYLLAKARRVRLSRQAQRMVWR